LETGAFELLLVTPIREAQIVFGRVSGIWQQFLPAFVIYGAGAIFLESGWSGDRAAKAGTESVKGFLLLFVSAPVIGLYFSLLRWNFLVAWICASLMAMLLPVFVGDRMGFSRNEIVIGQLCVAAVFAWRIYRRLQNRLALSPVTVEAGC
jgi:ABC-type Na+ efflux pump permease subunit